MKENPNDKTVANYIPYSNKLDWQTLEMNRLKETEVNFDLFEQERVYKSFMHAKTC